MLSVQNGFAFDSKAFGNVGFPLIRIRDLKLGTSTETRYAGEFDSRYIVNFGDFLIGMDGEFGCYEWKGERALLNQRVCRLHGFGQELEPRFLFHGINAHLKAIEEVTGYTTVKHLSSKQILGIDLPIPSRAEQRRIVAILDEAFEGIATAKVHAEKNLRNARELFETLHQSVFATAGEGWIEQKLGDIASFRNGLNYTKQSKGQTVLIIGVKDFQNHFWAPIDDLDSVTLDGELSETDSLVEGDILSVRSNGNPALIGRCMLVGVLSGPVSHSGFTIRIRLHRSGALPQYVCQFLKSQEVRRKLVDGGNGANIKSLNQGTLSAVVVSLPPVETQQKLIARIEAMSDETNRLADVATRKLAALDELKLSLLHQAFSGAL